MISKLHTMLEPRAKIVQKTLFTIKFEPDSNDELEDNMQINWKMRALITT
jgi:hypothetical protein